ncbi:hypothetical protein R1T08_04945 [Streptomyces sp. SBC-4]|nr:hypothetical protein [Streptomyces sp. SBC-4]MDV5143647.1 hypothetical protein [Streptomyces sp. SBC-4]
MEVYDQLGFVTLHGSFDVTAPQLETFYRSHGFTVLDVGGKIEMNHLGPTLAIGSDSTERMFVRNRHASALPWADLLPQR